MRLRYATFLSSPNPGSGSTPYRLGPFYMQTRSQLHHPVCFPSRF
jgi:hypothetical protein